MAILYKNQIYHHDNPPKGVIMMNGDIDKFPTIDLPESKFTIIPNGVQLELNETDNLKFNIIPSVKYNEQHKAFIGNYEISIGTLLTTGIPVKVHGIYLIDDSDPDNFMYEYFNKTIYIHDVNSYKDFITLTQSKWVGLEYILHSDASDAYKDAILSSKSGLTYDDAVKIYTETNDVNVINFVKFETLPTRFFHDNRFYSIQKLIQSGNFELGAKLFFGVMDDESNI